MLKPETATVWEWLKDQPAARGFVLVGGTALSMHLDHRISEDLDLVWVNSPKLPREQLMLLLKKAEEVGMNFSRDDNDAAYDEFLNAGMSLHDYQQDFIVNDAVKVTFFCGDNATLKILEDHSNLEKVAIAGVSELSILKTLLLSSRTKSRDWFDVYSLLKGGHSTITDLKDAYIQHSDLGQLDSALEKIAAGLLPSSDEGYEDLLESPPSLAEISTFFSALRDELEIETAKFQKKRD